MTLDKIRTAMACLIETTLGRRPNCLNCNEKKFCDDITYVILKHKTKEKEKINTEQQEELLKPPSRYKAF